MKKRIFRGAGFILLTLSLPAIGWSIADSTETKGAETGIVIPKKEPAAKPAAIAVRTLSSAELFNNYISQVYTETGLKHEALDYNVFKKAVTGYLNFKRSNLISTSKEIVSIVDFSKPSTFKRLWIIDLAARKVLYNTYVAHGQGSGDNYATNFSNTANSHQSSLGFYITSNTYFGKHGLSLKLNGMDAGHNSNALNRAVVVHGAEYVSENFINQHGRLGRSFGCPALPVELTPSIIETIKGRTMLFINGADKKYASNFLDENLAASNFPGQPLQTATTL